MAVAFCVWPSTPLLCEDADLGLDALDIHDEVDNGRAADGSSTCGLPLLLRQAAGSGEGFLALHSTSSCLEQGSDVAPVGAVPAAAGPHCACSPPEAGDSRKRTGEKKWCSAAGEEEDGAVAGPTTTGTISGANSLSRDRVEEAERRGAREAISRCFSL